MYDKKLEKLQSYGSKYAKYGYNPFVNNEEFYDKNTSNLEQYGRSIKGAMKLATIGFTDNALFGAFSGKDSFKDFGKTVDMYSSSRGGVHGFAQNLLLNGGYTVGIAADMAIEELAMAGLTALTLGAASEVTVPGMALKAGQFAKNLAKAWDTSNDIRKAINATKTAQKVSLGSKALSFINHVFVIDLCSMLLM